MSGCGTRTAEGSLEAVFESSDVERFGWSARNQASSRTGDGLSFGLSKLQLRCADRGKDPRIVIAGAPKRVEYGRKICRKPLRQSLAIRRRTLAQFVKVRTILERDYAVIAVDHELDPVGQRRRGRVRRLI